jgi:predicted nucleic acid-binding protein/plasmid stability protein
VQKFVMADIVLRNLDDPLKERLRQVAASHQRSMNAEPREIVRDALTRPRPLDAAALRHLAADLRALSGGRRQAPSEDLLHEARGDRQSPRQTTVAKWVVDASAAAKWLAPEAESAQADALLGETLTAPDLLFAEVANILGKKVSRGEMDAATADTAARWLRQVPLRVVECGVLMRDAPALSIRLDHPAYDCCDLALTARGDGRVVTADRRLVARCERAEAADLRGLVVWVGDWRP